MELTVSEFVIIPAVVMVDPVNVEYNTVDTLSVELTTSELVVIPEVVIVDPTKVE